MKANRGWFLFAQFIYVHSVKHCVMLKHSEKYRHCTGRCGSRSGSQTSPSLPGICCPCHLQQSLSTGKRIEGHQSQPSTFHGHVLKEICLSLASKSDYNNHVNFWRKETGNKQAGCMYTLHVYKLKMLGLQHCFECKKWHSNSFKN